MAFAHDICLFSCGVNFNPTDTINDINLENLNMFKSLKKTPDYYNRKVKYKIESHQDFIKKMMLPKNGEHYGEFLLREDAQSMGLLKLLDDIY